MSRLLRKVDIDMAVTLLCPNLRCRAVLQVPDNVRGKNVRCGHCSTVFTVPMKAAEPAHRPQGAEGSVSNDGQPNAEPASEKT